MMVVGYTTIHWAHLHYAITPACYTRLDCTMFGMVIRDDWTSRIMGDLVPGLLPRKYLIDTCLFWSTVDGSRWIFSNYFSIVFVKIVTKTVWSWTDHQRIQVWSFCCKLEIMISFRFKILIKDSHPKSYEPLYQKSTL